ncbi:hypothetical protein M0805_006550 [Coniferiporia weirii]|nr:hypothetical protein M0805_006550 [Coniferiporia weirii]
MDAFMDMDVDWCLTCNRRTSRGKPYCSRECKSIDIDCCPSTSGSSDEELESTPRRGSSRSRMTPTKRRSPRPAAPQQQRYYDEEEAARLAQWPGYNDVTIRAWASAIPPGCGSRQPEALSYCGPADAPRVRPEFPLSRQRPALPTLCMNATQPASMARSTSPITTPSPARTDAHAHAHAQASGSSSLVTALTESIATPESADPHACAPSPCVTRPKPSVLETFAARFRSRGVPTPAPAPTMEIMKTTTTTTTHEVSRPPQKTGFAGGYATGFNVLSTAHSSGGDDDDIFPFPPICTTVFPDAEIKETLAPEKRGVWIAGRTKAMEASGCGFGPAYYMKSERTRVMERAPVSLRVGSDFDRELAAYKSRGRKPARS